LPGVAIVPLRFIELTDASRAAEPRATIASEPEAMPGVTVLKAGTLDDRSAVRPATHIWCGSRQPWVEVPAGVTQFDKGRT